MSTPSCPRCGYDPSGIVASWERSCPTEGVCSECGLGFAWRDVLGERVGPVWFFEHARARRAGRLGVYAGVMVLAMHLWIVACIAVAAVVNHWQFLSWLRASGRAGLEPEFRYGAFLAMLAWPHRPGPVFFQWNNPWFHHPFGNGLVWGIVWCVLVPLGYFALGQTMAAARVRWVHLWRAGVYSLTFPLALAGVWSVLWVAARAGTWGGWAGYGALARPMLNNWAALGLIGVWLGVYWWAATWRYMRLRRAPAVVVAMLVMGFLGAAAVLYYIPGGFRGRMFELLGN